MNKQIDYWSRDDLIILNYLNGFTLQKTGQEFGISRERVRQILVKRNIKRPLTPLQIAQKQWNKDTQDLFGRFPTAKNYVNI